MILAAGRGERMGRLTAATPKPLLRIGGASLIEGQLARLAEAGVAQAIINLSYRGEQIRQAVGDGGRFGLRVVYSEEPPLPLETAGGIVEALPLLGEEPFLLVNADVVSDFDFARLVARPGPGASILIMVPNPAHNAAGDFGLDAAGRLTQAPPRLTYAGIARLEPKLFAGLAPGRRPLKPVLDAAIAAGRLFGLRHDGFWLDVGTPERLAEARKKRGQTPFSRQREKGV
jgi:MurNAc alpha-1-phosphate uridylyltransferase